MEMYACTRYDNATRCSKTILRRRRRRKQFTLGSETANRWGIKSRRKTGTGTKTRMRYWWWWEW
jgi:hypothetical protein